MRPALEDRIRRLEKHFAALCGQNIMLLSLFEDRSPRTEKAISAIKEQGAARLVARYAPPSIRLTSRAAVHRLQWTATVTRIEMLA